VQLRPQRLVVRALRLDWPGTYGRYRHPHRPEAVASAEQQTVFSDVAQQECCSLALQQAAGVLVACSGTFSLGVVLLTLGLQF